MNLSPMVAEWAEAYEQEHGHKPNELLVQITEHIMKVGDILTERGRKDAQKGEKAYCADDFPQLVRNAFGLDPEAHDDTVQAVADLWRDYYMDGHNAVKEVRSA